jgi:syntaxin 7
MSFQDLEAGRPSLQQQQRHRQFQKLQDPSQALASGIFQINTAVSSFSRLVNSLGTPKDTLELRDKL